MTQSPSSQSGSLHQDGKPLRALRVLALAAGPLYEDEVWRKARHSEWDTSTWHAALNTLVRRGYAERIGARGGYRWSITDAGREAVEL